MELEVFYTFEQFFRGLQFASEISKQTLTLATGVLALTITFSRDRLHRLSPKALFRLKLAWIFLLLTIFFALCNLRAYTAALMPAKRMWAKVTSTESVIEAASSIENRITSETSPKEQVDYGYVLFR